MSPDLPERYTLIVWIELAILRRRSSMAASYTAVIQKHGEWWIGWVEEVPGVNSQGQTREELFG